MCEPVWAFDTFATQASVCSLRIETLMNWILAEAGTSGRSALQWESLAPILEDLGPWRDVETHRACMHLQLVRKTRTKYLLDWCRDSIHVGDAILSATFRSKIHAFLVSLFHSAARRHGRRCVRAGRGKSDIDVVVQLQWVNPKTTKQHLILQK